MLIFSSFSLSKKSVGRVLLPKLAVKFERYLMGELVSVGAEVGKVELGKKVLFSDINAYEVSLTNIIVMLYFKKLGVLHMRFLKCYCVSCKWIWE
ncbi:hypothetical protein E1A91_D07G198400v1 [Gossypium mustelinum]|uniref:Uncharacterized protein n=1 Tax=Gossypium mustelinum TaxID=34275 RepID=A0A5D2UA63_GOSMU|nr:hypothetical protein E1A91_D07G198400v1 [Gossypium mustelinum]